jgi:hypothetical protein
MIIAQPCFVLQKRRVSDELLPRVVHALTPNDIEWWHLGQDLFKKLNNGKNGAGGGHDSELLSRLRRVTKERYFKLRIA